MQIHPSPVVAAPRPALPRFGEDTSLEELKRKKWQTDRQAAIDAYYKDYGHGITGESVLKLVARIIEEQKKKDEDERQAYKRLNVMKRAWMVLRGLGPIFPEVEGVNYYHGIDRYFPNAHLSAANKAQRALLEHRFLVHPTVHGEYGYGLSSYIYLTDLGRQMLAGEIKRP
jgi:hypothetical protein